MVPDGDYNLLTSAPGLVLVVQDPALLRPGRLDRKIEFPNPSRREKRLIFQTITSKMSMGADVDLEDCKHRDFEFAEETKVD